MNALSARPQAVRAPRGAVACRATKVAKLDFSRWKAINVTKMNLIESQGGRTTRNIDGSVYDISYEAGSDVVVVVDRQKGLRYPAMVGEDNRVRIDLESGEAAAVGLSLEPLQQVGHAPAILLALRASSDASGGQRLRPARLLAAYSTGRQWPLPAALLHTVLLSTAGNQAAAAAIRGSHTRQQALCRRPAR